MQANSSTFWNWTWPVPVVTFGVVEGSNGFLFTDSPVKQTTFFPTNIMMNHTAIIHVDHKDNNKTWNDGRLEFIIFGAILVIFHLFNVAIFVKELWFYNKSTINPKKNVTRKNQPCCSNRSSLLKILSLIGIGLFSYSTIVGYLIVGQLITSNERFLVIFINFGLTVSLYFRFVRLKVSFKGSTYEISTFTNKFIIFLLLFQVAMVLVLAIVNMHIAIVGNSKNIPEFLSYTTLVMYLSIFLIDVLSEGILLLLLSKKLLSLTIALRRRHHFCSEASSSPTATNINDSNTQAANINSIPMPGPQVQLSKLSVGSDSTSVTTRTTGAQPDLDIIDVKLDSKQQRLLNLVVKQTVLSSASMIIIFGFVLYAILFFFVLFKDGYGRSEAYFGAFWTMVTFVILSMMLELSFSFSNKWYQFYCKICHKQCQKACQTFAKYRIRKLTMENDRNLDTV